MLQIPSKLLENAVNELSRLPGIGKKTALRLALHLLKQDAYQVQQLSESLVRMRNEIIFCEKCFNISDDTYCTICNNRKRDATTICVVETIKDVIAIENTHQYNGLYHVLGSLISPIEGISPEKTTIPQLFERVKNEEVNEIIIALNATTDGETTTYYIHKHLQQTDVKISILARGIAFGSEIEYADELTLARSLSARLPYNHQS